jgi:hypothetical protein
MSFPAKRIERMSGTTMLLPLCVFRELSEATLPFCSLSWRYHCAAENNKLMRPACFKYCSVHIAVRKYHKIVLIVQFGDPFLRIPLIEIPSTGCWWRMWNCRYVSKTVNIQRTFFRQCHQTKNRLQIASPRHVLVYLASTEQKASFYQYSTCFEDLLPYTVSGAHVECH